MQQANLSQKRKRIAIVGSGIGGLTAAWLLRDSHDVTVFEKHANPGMGIFAVDYTSNGERTRIDIPTRIFCDAYYPNLTAMFRAIDVRIQRTNHAGAFSSDERGVYFHYGNRHLLGRMRNYPKGSQWMRPSGLAIVRDSLRFFRQAQRDCENDSTLATITFQDYLARRGYSGAFVNGVLLPMLSVMCTCDYEGVLAYPADMMLTCLTCGVMEQEMVRAEAGVDDIVPRLLGNATMHCGTGVDAIEPSSGSVTVIADGQRLSFDEVIIAGQAQDAAAMLSAYPHYAELLKRVPFQKSVMRVHTDSNVRPQTTVPLSPVNYFVPPNSSSPEVTVDLTRAFPTYRHHDRVYQTWNPIRESDDVHSLAEAEFTRPTVTLDSRAAVQALQRQQQTALDGIWLCGAYMADKVPLLEAAVDSAIGVASQFGASLPWET